MWAGLNQSEIRIKSTGIFNVRSNSWTKIFIYDIGKEQLTFFAKVDLVFIGLNPGTLCANIMLNWSTFFVYF